VKSQDEALVEIYRKLRPGDPPSVDSAKTLLGNLFFDHKRYDMAKVGRYKMNKKLGQHLECKQCGILSKAGNIRRVRNVNHSWNTDNILLPEDINSVVRYIIDSLKAEKKTWKDRPCTTAFRYRWMTLITLATDV
jgi:hypothetical protein